MSIDYAIILPIADAVWDDLNPQPTQSVKMTDDGTDVAYLATSDGDPLPDWPVSAAIWGAWDRTQVKDNGYLQFGETYDTDGITVLGTPTFPINPLYWDWVNTLGNAAGRATNTLRVVRWQGAPAKKQAVTDTSEYPATDSPFTLEIQRQDYGSTAQPWDNSEIYSTGEFVTSGGMWKSLQDNNQGNTPFGGSPFWEFINQSGFWGWVVFMVSADPLRDIAARAVGIYTDPECTIFQYTTGAFINDGKYGDRFYTECPPGNRLATSAQVNFALLLGSAQEGWMNLPEGGDGEINVSLYWAADQ
jgi:hypothetical protein